MQFLVANPHDSTYELVEAKDIDEIAERLNAKVDDTIGQAPAYQVIPVEPSNVVNLR